MSFLRKLFGSGNRQPKPSRRPASSAPSSSEPPPAAPGPPPARVPTLAELSPRPLHAYYEYVGGGSSKFYAVSLEEEDGDSWRVRFNFGRIGFPRAWASRVEGASWAKAAKAFEAVVEEREGKGYELRPWPAYLKLPDGTAVDDDDGEADDRQDGTLFRAAKRGTLPAEHGGVVAGVALPDGRLYEPEPEGGSRGEGPVVWASVRAVP